MEHRIKFIDLRPKWISWGSLMIAISLLSIAFIFYELFGNDKSKFGLSLACTLNAILISSMYIINLYKNGFSYHKKWCHIKLNKRWLKQFIYEDIKEIVFTDYDLTIKDNKATTVFSLKNINKADVLFLKEKLEKATDKPNRF